MKTIFKEYDSKHLLKQLEGNDIFKISNDLNFSTLTNTDLIMIYQKFRYKKNFLVLKSLILNMIKI